MEYLIFNFLFSASFENILSDVNQIKRGMQMTEKQFEVSGDEILKKFISTNRSKVDKVTNIFFMLLFLQDVLQIIQDTETAKEAYENVVKYFGETPKTMPPETFFPMVSRFIEAYKKAEKEVEERKIVEVRLLS